MKLAALKPRDQRLLAVALAVAALALVYVLTLHWWFVAPMQQVSADMHELRDTQSRYAAAVAQAPALRQRLAALGSGQAASAAFLPTDDPNTATGELMQRVVDVVGASTHGGRCDVSQKMPLPATAVAPGEPYRKATVSISLSCDMQPLAAVLQALEQGTPYLFVDDLSIYRNPVAAQQNAAAPLEVQFTLSGYVRPARVGTAAGTEGRP